jgi:hypothetical protein
MMYSINGNDRIGCGSCLIGFENLILYLRFGVSRQANLQKS